ncbi:MAG TPA: prenyltransferase, partial [Rhabdochlamydiaceae bacterium]|nr:prenyltransferase [Rhabdochlamydiaceae bacterium]
PVAVASVYYLQTDQLSLQLLFAGLSSGLISSGILLVNNIRDVEEDRNANKKTLVVRFGSSFGKKLFAFCLISSTLLPLLFYSSHPFIVLVSLTLLPCLFLIKEIYTNQDPKLLNPLLGKTAKFLLVYTLIFCFSWMM